MEQPLLQQFPKQHPAPAALRAAGKQEPCLEHAGVCSALGHCCPCCSPKHQGHSAMLLPPEPEKEPAETKGPTHRLPEQPG